MAEARRGFPGDSWRWQIDRHVRPTYDSYRILVSEPSDEAKTEREKKIEAGAEIVPFGFIRVIPPSRTAAEPLLWEGDGA